MSIQASAGSRSSLTRRFNIALLLIYLGSILIAAPAVFFYTKTEVYDRADKELVLLVDVVKSIQDYVATDLRPHFLEQGVFYSPAISGIVATARVAQHLKKKQPQYYIRSVSDNPLNPDNQARGLEQEILSRFRNNRALASLSEEGVIGGKSYLVSAAPKISNKKGCMRCHGSPEKAPEDVVSTYGTGSGYGYKFDQVVGISVVGVPLDSVQLLTLKRSGIVIGALTFLFALLFISVNTLVRRLILVPIADITDVAKAVSGGDLYRVVDTQDRRDEIGELSRSFELMRRSLVAAMKRIRGGRA